MDYVTVEEQKPQISEELRLIPMWSVALAIVLFALVQAVVHLYLTRHEHNIPPRGFLVFWSLAWGTVIAVYDGPRVLLVLSSDFRLQAANFQKFYHLTSAPIRMSRPCRITLGCR